VCQLSEKAGTGVRSSAIVQEFLKEVIVTFGDLLASLGFIVIGLLARRLWLVIIMAVIWACVAYAVRLQDQLGIPFAELPDAIDWAQVQAEMPLRFGIAVAISFAAWACMGLIIGSFRPTPKRRPARAAQAVAGEGDWSGRGRQERREPMVGAAPARARAEPSLGRAVEEEAIPPLPLGLRRAAPAPEPQPAAPPPPRPTANFDVVLPRDPSAAAAALRRLYGDKEIDEILSELKPGPRPGRN
jgi:hypothetical protein